MDNSILKQWPIYENPDLGIRFQYPSVFANPGLETKITNGVSVNWVAMTGSTPDQSFPIRSLVLGVTEQGQSDNLEAEIKKADGPNPADPQDPRNRAAEFHWSKISIDGIDALKAVYQRLNIPINGRMESISSVVTCGFYWNKKHYGLALTGDPDGESVMDQIIASFSFLKK